MISKRPICGLSLTLVMGLAPACGTPYTPKHTGAIGLTGDAYIKDGKRHDRDLWVANLGSLVQGCAPAEAAARSARRNQIAALTLDTVSAITGIVAFVIALSSERANNDVMAQIMFNTSLATAILGPAYHIRAHDRELDAVNSFNDSAVDRACVRSSPPGPRHAGAAWGGTNGRGWGRGGSGRH